MALNTTPYSASASAAGYEYQIRWGLYELLRMAADRPDGSVSLEVLDDLAWESARGVTEMIQLKHHLQTSGGLGDYHPDIWRTLRVWIDEAHPGDPSGPALTLVTTTRAEPETAAFYLRPQSRNEDLALEKLQTAARDSRNAETSKARSTFLELGHANQMDLDSRIQIIDNSPTVDQVDDLVRKKLLFILPRDHEDLFLALVWKWWDEQSLGMLLGRVHRVDVEQVKAVLDELRDQFTHETLPTLVNLSDVDEAAVVAEHHDYPFVHQMNWVRFPPRNLQKAIVDYFRAYTQSVRWIDEDLIAPGELSRFEMELVDEWEREFDFMLDDLGPEADEEAKSAAGKQLLRATLGMTSVTIRARYQDAFFARGKRHELANRGAIGWHPDFKSKVAEVLAAAGAPSIGLDR